MNPRRALIAATRWAVAVCTTLLGCSGGPQSADPAADQEAVGRVDASLQIAKGVMLESVGYSITGPQGFTKSGAIDVHDSTTVAATISPLPAGTGFDIALSGTSVDGTTVCTGDAPFAITAGQGTPVFVKLDCRQGPATGSVMFSGTLNVCPSVDSIGVSPPDVLVGGTTQLTGTAHDLDQGPSPLAYHWTTDLGTLSDASAENPILTCTGPGTAHVNLTVTDGDPLASCVGSRDIAIVCQPAN